MRTHLPSREVVAPGEIKHPRPELRRQLARAVGRAGIDHDGLVDQVRGRLQAARQLRFLVPNHQAERYAHGCFLLTESMCDRRIYLTNARRFLSRLSETLASSV